MIQGVEGKERIQVKMPALSVPCEARSSGRGSLGLQNKSYLEVSLLRALTFK